MIQIAVITHGRLSQEFVGTAEQILGSQSHLAAVCLEPHEGIEDLMRKMSAALHPPDQEGDGCLALVDMFGGTPANVALAWAQHHPMRVITGASLPMLLEALMHRTSMPLDALADLVMDRGRQSILDAGALLADRGQGGGGA